MAIKPKCVKCDKELIESGAILLSPPDEHGRVFKFHLCVWCYSAVVTLIDKG